MNHTDLALAVGVLALAAALTFGVFYALHLVLAVIVGWVVRLTRAPLGAVVWVGYGLAGGGVLLLAVAWATAGSCESDATGLFWAATAVLPLALAVGRQLRRPGEGPAKPEAGWGVQGLAALGLVVWPVVVAAGLASRAMVATRSMTLGDLRTLASAEVAYATANGGFFDRIECLQAPARCLPGYGADKRVFLDASSQWLGVRWSYLRSFRPGPPAPERELRSGRISPTSLAAWAYIAVPSPRT